MVLKVLKVPKMVYLNGFPQDALNLFDTFLRTDKYSFDSQKYHTFFGFLGF